MTRSFALAVLLCAALPGIANSQEWPARQPIKIVVPFSAGSATDITARTVFDQVGKQIGQTFVIENRGGAGTTLGSNMVAKADPDGYTLLVNSTSYVVVASTYKQLPFSVTDDFAPIGGLADIPYIVTTPTKYKTMKELIDAGKKPDSHILYGSAGAGSSGQLFMELLANTAGYRATHVPFRGTPEGMTELVAGRIDIYAAPAVNAIPLTKDGKISSLAISSRNRLPLMADVPTLAEVGLPGAEYNFWVGAFAPSKTQKAIVERLNHEIVAALQVKGVADKITTLGGTPMPMAIDEFRSFVRKEIAVNARIVKESGFAPQ